jgi:hypothetical protein
MLVDGVVPALALVDEALARVDVVAVRIEHSLAESALGPVLQAGHGKSEKGDKCTPTVASLSVSPD